MAHPLLCLLLPVGSDVIALVAALLPLPLLLQQAQQQRIVAINGLLMLVSQAKEAAEWLLNEKLPDSLIQFVYDKMRQQMENIILIGMPGSGKSTVGRLLAQKTGRAFVDADEAIVAATGKSIPEIFAQDGEEAFRRLETQVLSQFGRQSGQIIATGGGCVTRAENYDLLHQNGKVFCLERTLEQLATDGRPLSQAAALDQMYRNRKPLYQHFADYHVSNNGSAEETSDAILRLWEEAL